MDSSVELLDPEGLYLSYKAECTRSGEEWRATSGAAEVFCPGDDP